jgi:7-keto-8-aminopelargonate synthetase-like enzyme
VLDKVVNDRGRAALVVIDGVYSMGGDIAELPSIVDVCKRFGARDGR